MFGELNPLVFVVPNIMKNITIEWFTKCQSQVTWKILQLQRKSRCTQSALFILFIRMLKVPYYAKCTFSRFSSENMCPRPAYRLPWYENSALSPSLACSTFQWMQAKTLRWIFPKNMTSYAGKPLPLGKELPPLGSKPCLCCHPLETWRSASRSPFFPPLMLLW